MKVIIFSDSHRNFNPMMKAIEREGNVDAIVHAGDVLADVEDLEIMYPRHNIIYVKGNNDVWDRTAPTDRFFELGGVKIFLTHGHMYGAKSSPAGVMKKGRELGADLCIFGHTHKAYHETVGGITLFNPGCASSYYGVLEIENGRFELRHCSVNG